MLRSLRLLPAVLGLAAATGTSLPARAQPAPGTEQVILLQAGPGTLAQGPVLAEGEALREIRSRLEGIARPAFDEFLAGRANTQSQFAAIDQGGESNIGLLEQDGAANVAVLVQRGNMNRSVVEQAGDGNITGVFISGDHNQFDVTQQGDGNVYLLDFEGDHLDHQVRQIGNYNEAVQLGVAAAPFSVEQQGDYMSIVVRHNGAE